MSLSDSFRSQASWRRQKAEEYPDDTRNAQSAAALESLAEHVEHGQHEAGSVIDALEHHLIEGLTLGGEETHRAVSRYGFGHEATSAHHADFLAELVVLCLVDEYEFAREHGEASVTDTLYPFELDAARADVFLPQSYFERRVRWTEIEAEQAVAAYAAGDGGGS